jgi:hypothetical protein
MRRSNFWLHEKDEWAVRFDIEIGHFLRVAHQISEALEAATRRWRICLGHRIGGG